MLIYGFHQATRHCQDKYVADILKKFDFTTIKAPSTLIETNKAFLKGEEAEDVDVHLYRSMIGSLMYLTALRPDIMFVVCACTRFQVTPKVSHLHAVKRIFRYLKGQPKLGLWYPMDSPFDLEAFSDNDHAGASLDRKSTTRAEYVAAVNCCGQNPVFHSKTKHIEIRHHFIRDCYEKKLIQVIKIHTDHNVADLLTKAFDVSRKAKRTTEISHSSGPIHLAADETVYKEWEDIIERAATTASSLEVEQDSGNINRTQSITTLNESFPQGTGLGSGPRCQDTILGVRKLKLDLRLHLNKSNDPPLSRVNTLGSREDNMKLMELMEHYTKLSELNPTESEGFEQIVEFLNDNPIKYALTMNPTLYASYIEQFWTSAKVKTVKEDVWIQALVDGKKVIVNETSIRRDLRLDDAEGTACLPNDTIF
ncbi:hypothetical protein Tco_0613911 [Tanacetum coccineum]